MVSILAQSELARGSEGIGALRATNSPWMVLHTKSRQEKAVARFLESAGKSFYLPLVERITITRGRKMLSRVPLFPGYVFLSGALDDAYAAISTRRVCQLIKVADQDRLVEQLEHVREALRRGAELYRCPFAVVGTRCRVFRGPFQGIEGVVSRRLERNRLALQIDTLGQAALLEIDADLLEPVA